MQIGTAAAHVAGDRLDSELLDLEAAGPVEVDCPAPVVLPLRRPELLADGHSVERALHDFLGQGLPAGGFRPGAEPRGVLVCVRKARRGVRYGTEPDLEP